MEIVAKTGIQPYWAKRWARALRTTAAPQIVGFLHDDRGGRCAVGVLYDELALDGLIPADWADIRSYGQWDDAHRANVRRAMPDSVAGRVATWNDGEQLTFAQIAERIEARIAPDEPPVDRSTREAYPALLAEGAGR